MRVAVAAIVLLLAAPLHAAGLGGRIKFDSVGYRAAGDSVDAMVGHRTSAELAAELRLNFSRARGPWTFDAAWQIDARHGSAVERDAGIANHYPLLASGGDDSYLDLDDTLIDRDASRAFQRVDRLNVAYARGALVARVGRQALTWGSGLVFHPMDLVNPFRPLATDTAYKRGTDMAYGQWLLKDGSDIQLAAVPHRHDDDAGADSGKATFAAFANITGRPVQWSLLLASDRADPVLGVGASGAFGGAAWNAELIPTWNGGAGAETSGLANLSYATTLLERNATLFAELYHNGFGETGSDYTAANLDPELNTRFARGQLFVTGRDYLSLGATWEWSPLLQLMPTLIYNVHDHSALLDLQLNRSLTNDAALKAGVSVPVGAKGSEFSGLQTAPMSGLYLADPAQAFVRLEYYF